MESQTGIKIILSLAVIVVGLGIAWPGRGARRMAIRRLGVLAVVAAGTAAVVFPQLTDKVAHLVGIGRGADLLTYGLAVSFGVYAIGARRERGLVHRQITEIARAQALAHAVPASAPLRPPAARGKGAKATGAGSA